MSSEKQRTRSTRCWEPHPSCRPPALKNASNGRRENNRWQATLRYIIQQTGDACNSCFKSQPTWLHFSSSVMRAIISCTRTAVGLVWSQKGMPAPLEPARHYVHGATGSGVVRASRSSAAAFKDGISNGVVAKAITEVLLRQRNARKQRDTMGHHCC